MKLQDRLLSPLLHLILYSSLLVATPFIMLQNFLQEAIGQTSEITFHIGSLELTLLPWLALTILIVILILVWKQLNLFRLAVLVLGLLLIALAQQLTDYYFHHNFYDLQQNWHYIAYSGFAWLMFRYLSIKRTPVPRIALYTFFIALAVSSFDEYFQLKMSSRVFDISDIAKDAWGVLIGLILVVFCTKQGPELLRNWKLRHKKFSGYINNTVTVLVLEMVFGLMLLIYSSLLTEVQYGWLTVGFTLGTFVPFFILLHISQYRIIGPIIYLLVIGTLLTGGIRYFTSPHQVSHCSYGMTVYRGIPVPFFDILIYPDGGFRLVDKKHFFNTRDKQTLLLIGADIMVIGTGEQDKGGNGFPKPDRHQFIFNPFIGRGTQVLRLPNVDAVNVFNKLKKEGKNVLFVIHNTC